MNKFDERVITLQKDSQTLGNLMVLLEENIEPFFSAY